MRGFDMQRAGLGSVMLPLLVVALVVGLTACGGGGDATPSDATPSDSAPAASPQAPAISADGGKVEASGVATVIVPPGALDAQTTIRVAHDSTGAPPVPAWFTPVGPMVAITPHGAVFTEPVTVRLPAPTATLAQGERLLIAKAQPGGSWEVFADTEEHDGQLEVKVRSLSVFTTVIVRAGVGGLQPVLGPPAFAFGPMSLQCDGRPCGATERLRAMTITATTSGNGGELPAGCSSPEIEFNGGLYTNNALPGGVIGTNAPIDGTGAFERSFPMPTQATTFYSPSGPVSLLVFASLVCTDAATRTKSRLTGPYALLPVDRFATAPSAPIVREFPASLSTTAGQDILVKAVLSGGASYLQPSSGTFAVPSGSGQAIVHVERQRPGESTWTSVLDVPESFTNSSPYGGERWMYWGFELPLSTLLGTGVSAADSGTGLRLRACLPISTAQYDCTIGPVARLTVLQQAQPPVFTTQPRSVTVQPGETASFTTQVSSTPAATLQWQRHTTYAWSNVTSNGTSLNYTTPPLTLADNGVQYRLIATNSAGSFASDEVTVTVSGTLVPPTITTQPASLNVVRGSEALFAVNASGTEALSYQWFKDGAPITSENAPQLKLGDVTQADAGAYTVQVSNAAGRVTSPAAQLSVSTAAPTAVAPAIVTQPAAVAVTEGNVATFAVGVTGSGPLSFQWRKNGVDIAGANAAAFTLPAVAIADGGNYSVRVSNAAGNATSQAATLAVAPVGGTPSLQPVVVVTQPGSVVVAPGMSAQLAVTVTGSGPMSYAWFRNGVAVPGQTSAVFSIAAASALDAGSYVVHVSNAAGTTISGAGQVMLLGAPAITAQPAAASALSGATATFSVAATGDALHYQWLRNNVAIAGADAASFTTPALALADSGAVFGVIVYNGAGLVFSSGAVLTVTSNGASTPAGMAIYAGDFSAGGGGNSGDGVGTGARFDYPEGLVADSAGNLYVASSNGGRVSKIDPNRVVTTLALPAGVSQFGLSPGGGDLYAASTSYCGLTRISPPLNAGAVVTPIPVLGCPGAETRGAAVDNNGWVYFALHDAHSIVRLTLSAQSGSMDATLFAGAANTSTGAGDQDGTGGSARFNGPRGIAFGPDGYLYVADTGNHTIRRITPQGVVSTFAGLSGQAGSVDGTTSAARFDSPLALAFDPSGNLVVLDRGPDTAVHARVRRVTPAGVVTTLFDAYAESLALAQTGQESFATNIKGLAVLDARRIALSAGNAVLVRTLP